MIFTDIYSWIIRSEVQTLTRVCNETSSFHVPLTSMRWTSPVIHEHCSTLGHSITHDKVEVILPEDNTLKRKIKEVVEDGPCLVPDGGLELKTNYGTVFLSSDHPEVKWLQCNLAFTSTDESQAICLNYVDSKKIFYTFKSKNYSHW